MFVGFGTNFWNFSIYELSENILLIESEFLPIYIKLIPLVFSIIGTMSGLVINYFFLGYSFTNPVFLNYFHTIYQFFNKKWYFDLIYNKIIVNSILKFSFDVTFKLIDRGALELIGPSGVVRVFTWLTKQVSKIFHNGLLFDIFYMLMVGFYFIILFIFVV